MNSVNPVLAKELHETSHAAGVDRTLNTKYFRLESAASEELAEPSNSALWSNGYDRVTAAAELVRQAEYHHLRSSGLVRLEHHRDPQAG
jgi:hypothetical protein